MGALIAARIAALIAALAPQPQRAQRVPGLARRGAPAGHLAGLGATVDLDQRAAEGRFGLRRQLRRQRRRGRQRQRHRRQRQAGQQQRLEVERRRHQGARLGHALQRSGDVGRIEGPAGVEAGAAQQGQQHRRLEAVAVLRRHRGHDRDAGQRGPLQQLRQSLGLGGDVGHQRPPALGVRLRRAGGAAGQQAHGLQVRRDRGHHRRRPHQGRPLNAVHRQASGGGRRAVDQQVGRAAGSGYLAQGLGQRVGRHQCGLPAQQRGGQTEGEEVAVLAQVDGSAGGQAFCHGLGLGDEAGGRDRSAAAPGQRLRQVALCQQRQQGVVHEAGSALAAR